VLPSTETVSFVLSGLNAKDVEGRELKETKKGRKEGTLNERKHKNSKQKKKKYEFLTHFFLSLTTDSK
jgi:hypothetical protein